MRGVKRKKVRRRRVRAKRRPPKIKAGSFTVYAVAGKLLRVRVLRQTPTGRITIVLPNGKKRSIYPGSRGT